ncbi:MAG: hypothetical protein H7289_11305 [Mucilaginibacter sp.]|nr:hypothetical protein [Mucilaginibacter sp.]
MKPNISANDGLFKTHKSYTPEEIFAAGGTTAFGRKSAQNKMGLVKALENLPPIEPFTDEEWADLLDQLEKDK